jgi:hypothetical protein
MIEKTPSSTTDFMVTEPEDIIIEKKYESVTGTDSGIVGSLGSTSTWDESDLDESHESRDNILLELDPESKQKFEDLKKREHAQKLDRKRHLLITKLQHLRKCANVLVIGPQHAGKTSLINSMGYMIRKDEEGNHLWKTLAEYDLGKSFKYKPTQMWPLDKRSRVENNVTFYEAGGFEKVGDTDKAATILQYALEGRITACSLLQMFLLVNTNDITERYREDPNDPRVLEGRRIDAIIHVTPANESPNKALFSLITQAINQSRDPRIRKMPILTCVTTPHGAPHDTSPVHELKDYDLGSFVRKSQDGGQASMRRNHSLSRLSMGHPSPQPLNLCEPATVRKMQYYAPEYDMLNDESDISSIVPTKEIDQSLLQLFEDTLRVAQREHPSIRKRFLGFIMDMLN